VVLLGKGEEIRGVADHALDGTLRWRSKKDRRGETGLVMPIPDRAGYFKRRVLL